MSMSDDRELVRRLLRGEEAAFDLFISEYYPRLYRFAHRRLRGNADEALDAVQATFQKVIPRLGSWRGEAPLFSWMCGFCRFEIAAMWKSEGGPQIAEDDPAVRAVLDSLPALDDAPDRAYERKALGRAVRMALDYLPRHYAAVLEWKYVQGLPVQEIAGRLATTPKAAESLLTRARQAFREAFTELAERTT
jgi:RNA polymerase sigma-70 factor (ECF subfamily)